jgi:hypothetical protein
MSTQAYKLTLKVGDDIKTCTVVCLKPTTVEEFQECMIARFGKDRLIKCKKVTKTKV